MIFYKVVELSHIHNNVILERSKSTFYKIQASDSVKRSTTLDNTNVGLHTGYNPILDEEGNVAYLL
jgi:hypothetical protein